MENIDILVIFDALIWGGSIYCFYSCYFMRTQKRLHKNILLIPGNMLIHNIAGTTNVNAQLPVMGAVILITLSVILTLIGGLIPSRKAAKSDPVTALRSE